MSSAARSSAIALHVQAAKRLLQELELHSDTAINALGRESGADFFAAVDKRDRILEELKGVVEAITDGQSSAESAGRSTVLAGPVLDEMTLAAAAALESHQQLLMRTRQERDRLAAALHTTTTRTDSVANHYAAASITGRSRTFSVTG